MSRPASSNRLLSMASRARSILASRLLGSIKSTFVSSAVASSMSPASRI